MEYCPPSPLKLQVTKWTQYRSRRAGLPRFKHNVEALQNRSLPPPDSSADATIVFVAVALPDLVPNRLTAEPGRVSLPRLG